jgi:hypothetical protein
LLDDPSLDAITRPRGKSAIAVVKYALGELKQGNQLGAQNWAEALRLESDEESVLKFIASSLLGGGTVSTATVARGFVAHPVGGMVCGHFGDRLGRKSMLVTALLITGGARVVIGLLPGRESIGLLAPALLVTMRFAQGFGIGGEWGGAVLTAVEPAPAGRRSLYGDEVEYRCQRVHLWLMSHAPLTKA